MSTLIIAGPLITPGDIASIKGWLPDDDFSEYRFSGDGNKSIWQYIRELCRRSYGRAVLVVNNIDAIPRLVLLKGMVLLPRAKQSHIIDFTGRTIRIRWIGFLTRDIPLLIWDYLWKYVFLSQLNRELRLLERGTFVPPMRIEALHRLVYLRTDIFVDKIAGGSIGHIAGVANAFHRLGYEISFISSDKPRLIDPHAIPIHIIPPSHRFEVIEGLPILYYNHTFCRNAKRIISKYRPDFIYQRYGANNYSGVQLSRECRLPLVLEYNGSEIWVAKHWSKISRYQSILERIETLNLRAAYLIVVVSEVLREELIARGIPADKIIAHPNGVDPERFELKHLTEPAHDIRQNLGLKDKVVIGFISTFEQFHGPLILAHSIKKIISQSKQRVHFLLIGDGQYKQQVEQIVEGDDVSEYVTFLGTVPQNQAPEYLMACDIFVSPHIPNPDGSRFFGSPTKLFEYMALGKGIVASDLDQIGQILHSGVTAILVKPGDINDFVNGVVRLINDRQLADRLGQAARSEVLNKYTWEQNVQAITQKLSSLLTTGDRP